MAALLRSEDSRVRVSASDAPGPSTGSVPLEVEIPLAEVRGLFHTVGADPVRYAGDPRALRSPNARLDPLALWSVLQFGTVLPPRSVWYGVARLVPGLRYRLDGPGPVPCGPAPLPSVPARDWRDSDAQADAVEALLDAELMRVERPVVLFSGGVDSGLLAARLAALGRTDALLVNYAFGSDDAESHVAERMARHLGLRFERVGAAPREQGIPCLERPGEVYPSPFADWSTDPSFRLAHAVLGMVPAGCTLLDGTGADGGFGLRGKVAGWERVARVPAVLRHPPALAHRWLWQRPGRAEAASRLLRRSVQMPFASAVLAQNALGGIAYSDAAGEGHSLLDRWLDACELSGTAERVIGADLAMTCANTFAQKMDAILVAAGRDVAYPFLSRPLLALAFLAAREWPASAPKAALKHALLRHVPPDLVHRPKSGFIDPAAALFGSEAFLSYLSDAGSAGSPLEGSVHRGALERALGSLHRGRALPLQTLNLLWAAVFLDRWLRTVPPPAAFATG